MFLFAPAEILIEGIGDAWLVIVGLIIKQGGQAPNMWT